MRKPAILQRAKNSVSRFATNKDGQLAFIFALAFVPLMGFVGTAIDYSRGISVKAALNAAADAAALNAVTLQRNSLTYTPPTQATVRGFFDGAALDSQYVPETSGSAGGTGGTGNGGSSGGTATFQYVAGSAADAVATNGTSATITYTAYVPTYFMQVFGIPTMTISGTASARSKLATYLNFFMLMDNSPSMGLAGSQTDITNMEAATKGLKDPQSGGVDSGGCAFACHVHAANLPRGVTQDFYTVAKAHNIQTRIDYMKTAVNSLLARAAQPTLTTNQFQFGLYTFNAPCTYTSTSACTSDQEGTQIVSDLAPINTASLSTMQSKVSTIDLTYTYPGNPDDQTDIDGALAFAQTKVAAVPVSVVKPLNYVVLVSDGLQDKVDTANCSNQSPSYAWPGGCRHIATVTASACQALKDKGTLIAVVYTPYLTLPTGVDTWTDQHVSPFTTTSSGNSKVQTALQSCASSSSLFVSTGAGVSIGDALNTIFTNALAQTRLTQ